MIQPELVQHGRVQVVHVALLIDRAEPELIRLADDVAGLDAAAGHPHGERVDVMVAPRRLPRLAHRRAAKLAAPYHQRVVEHPVRLEILHQRRTGLVDFVCHLVEVLGEGLTRAAVAVPVRMVQLHKPRAALHEAPRQEAVVGVAWFALLNAVQVKRRLGLAGDIH